MLRISRLLHASPIPRRSLAKFTPDAFSHNIGRRNLHFTESEYGSQPGREPTQEELFDAYSETINLNASSQTVPITAELAVVLPRAHELGASHVLRDIASRYLLSSERDDALGHALLESDRSMSLLSRSQAVAIFKRLADHEHNLEYLSTNVLIYMGHVGIIDSASNLFAMEAILFTLLERWSQHQGIGHEHHYHGTWAIFQLLREIMKIAPENGQRQFTAMLQSKPWWPEGSTVIDQAIKDPAIIASMFMLRCCMAWRWWERGHAVAHELIHALSNDATMALPIHTALASLIKAHIDSAGLLIEPSLCAALICAMADEPSLPPLSNTVLQQFYKSCAESKPPKPETANAVYLYLREKQFSTLSPNATASEGLSPKVPHSYQPPTGRRILTLLDLYHRTNDHNSARLLVSDVQKRLDTIPTDILVSYLIFLIKLSFATEARAVYSMCLASTDPDKGAITLLPSVSRHLVTLFVSMADAAHRRSTMKGKRREYQSQQAKELMQFAKQVARRYRRSVLPLEKWEHQRLTTLARIYFIIGDLNEGFKVLKMISCRTDILPDAHDMSVVLHLLASVDPPRAVRLLDYMITKGVEPESPAYGIVAAQCLKQGDFQLAGEILIKAKKRGRKDLDSKLLGAICWHSISAEGLKGVDREETVARLQTVLEHLGLGDGFREAIFRERTLGVRAANVALDIHRPDLALKFWTRCIQHKTIARQPNDKNVKLERDQEHLLRSRILKQSNESGVVTWNLPQSVAEALSTSPRPKPVKQKRSAIDDRPLPT